MIFSLRSSSAKNRCFRQELLLRRYEVLTELLPPPSYPDQRREQREEGCALELEEAVEDDVALAGLAKHDAFCVRTRSICHYPAHGCPPKPKSGVAES